MGGRQRGHVVDFAVGGAAAMERSAIPGGHPDRRIGRVLRWVISAACDRVRAANQILSPAPRHSLAVGHDLPAGVAVLGLGEMFAAMGIGDPGGLRGGATGKRQGGQAEACASPSPHARRTMRF